RDVMADTHRARSASIRFLLLILGLLAAVTLTQCRAVTDLVASRVHPDNAGSCIAQCAHAYADSTRAESAIHVANGTACGGDATCLATEDTRHDAAIARIEAGRIACQSGCHHQGGGTGGN